MNGKLLQNGLNREENIQRLNNYYRQGAYNWQLPDVDIIRDIPLRRLAAS